MQSLIDSYLYGGKSSTGELPVKSDAEINIKSRLFRNLSPFFFSRPISHLACFRLFSCLMMARKLSPFPRYPVMNIGTGDDASFLHDALKQGIWKHCPWTFT